MPPLEFPSSPANGALNQQFQYDASITAWRNQGSTQNVGTAIAALQTFDAKNVGLKNIVPTTITPAGSGSSGSFNSLGLVTFSNVVGVYIQGIFSSSFDNYCVVYDIRSSGTDGADIYIRTANGGTAYSGTTYERALLFYGPGQSPTVISGNDQSLLTIGFKGALAGYPIVGKTDIFAPYLATATGFSGASTSNWGSGTIHTTHGGREYTATSRDGIVIGATGGTINGTAQVFGYNNK